jgi:hypothetical protein
MNDPGFEALDIEARKLKALEKIASRLDSIAESLETLADLFKESTVTFGTFRRRS